MNSDDHTQKPKAYSLLNYLAPKYPGNAQTVSSSNFGNSKPVVVALPSSASAKVVPVAPVRPLKDENRYHNNDKVPERHDWRAKNEYQVISKQSDNPMFGAKKATKAANSQPNRDDLDFFLCLEREEHNRKLHEEDQSKWSFLMKRKSNEVDDKHDKHNNSSGYYKGNGGSYYNDKKSIYTDEDKWTAQLEQLRAEKNSARPNNNTLSVYDLTQDDNLYLGEPHQRSEGGFTDSAYYSSGVTDLYSVGRAQASFLDAAYASSDTNKKKPEQSKGEDDANRPSKVILDIHQFAKKSSGQTSANTNTSSNVSAPVANAFLQNFNILYQTQLLNTDLSSGNDLDALINSSIDSICVEMLKLNLGEVLAYEESEAGERRGRNLIAPSPPVSFLDVNSYISFFQPLLIDEFKAALISYILDIHGEDRQEQSVIDASSTATHKSPNEREFDAVEVRPEVISQRGQDSKLHEVHLRVLRQESRHVDFIKDELVVITNHRIPDSKSFITIFVCI